MHRRSVLASGIMLFALVWAVVPAGAETIIVDSDHCTLRAAIIAANTDAAAGTCPAGSGADTIELPVDATISLATFDNINDGLNGLPVITSEIIINGNEAVVERNPADGIICFRIFHVGESGNLTLNDLTVKNGRSGPLGGGILNRGTTTLTNSTLTNNLAGIFYIGSGGAIWNAVGGTLSLTSCTVSSNTATDQGGGIWSQGELTLTNCLVSDNLSFHHGGGILNRGTATITDSTVIHNIAGMANQNGGGILNSFGGTLTLTSCTVSYNTASRKGGGIWNNSNGELTMTNCLVNGNVSTLDAGGMMNFGTASLTNSTISGNSGPGLSSLDTFPDAMLELTSSVVWGNSSNMFSSSETTVSYSDVQGGWKGVGNIDADPLFDNAYRLTAGSPCIDAADNTAVPAGIVTDLAGNPRFVDDPATPDSGNPDGINPIVDMGAHEFNCVDDDGDGRLTICHMPPGNLIDPRTITISVKALPAHLAHGDHCGWCEDGRS